MSGFIGRFKIIREIGFGGVGRVYCARDPLLKRDVALKVLLAGEFADETELVRFQREVESSAKLRHANIVPLYEVGREAGKGLYMVMEYIEGIALDDFIHQKKVFPHQAAKLTWILAKVLHYAHNEGIIHRDIKPQNVLMRDEKIPMITDFGLARKMDAEDKDKVTKTGDFVGTPGYMAPEQINGEAPIPQMDVYALGTIFFELLTGTPAYQGQAVEILYNVLDDAEMPPSPKQRRPEIARDLDIICQKAMHKDYRRRYQTALELAEDIEKYLDGKPIAARPIGMIERSYRWGRRHIALLLTIVLCFFGLITAVFLAHLRQKNRIEEQINHFVEKGNQLLKESRQINDGESNLWLDKIRKARKEYELALGLDFNNERIRKQLYRLEISYGLFSLEKGMIERSEDALASAKVLNIKDRDWQTLKENIEKEKKILDALSQLRHMAPNSNNQEISQVIKRYPKKAIRYLIVHLSDPKTGILARRLFKEEVRRVLTTSQAENLLSISSLSEKEAYALGEIARQAFPEIIPALLPKISGNNIRTLKNTLTIVCATGTKEAAPYLISVITNPGQNPHWKNLSIQVEACKALGSVKNRATMFAIIQLLQKRNLNINVAIAATKALAHFGSSAQDAIAVLKQQLQSDYPISLRFQSCKTLMAISSMRGIQQIVNVLQKDIPTELSSRLWIYLANWPKRDFIQFIMTITQGKRFQDSPFQLRRLPNSTAKILGNKFNQLLVSGIPEQNAITVIRLLSELPVEFSGKGLKTALNSSNAIIRREAAFAVCKQKWPAKQNIHFPIDDLFEQETDRYSQFYMGWALAKYSQTDEVLNRSEKLLKNDDFLVRLAGVLASKKEYYQIKNLLEILTSP